MDLTNCAGLLEHARQASLAHGRADLAHRLRLRQEQLGSGPVVAVVGFAKQGKSSLLNALLNAPVCPAGDLGSGTVPLRISYSPEPSANLVYSSASPALPQRQVSTPIERIAAAVTDRAGEPGLAGVEIGLPREVLGGDLVLVDTPAIEAPGSPATTIALSVLDRAHAAILVTDAHLGLGTAELALARYIATWCPNLLVALTKIDGSTRWPEVAEHNRGLLSSAGVRTTVLPLSAAVRAEAARVQDNALNERSGFPELLRWLERERALSTADRDARTCATPIRVVAEELVAPIKSEMATTASRQGLDQVGAAQQAQRVVDELRKHTSRWQNLLSDEITDLLGDLEYDLRERTRAIVMSIDRTFDKADPRKTWPDFQKWLEERLAEAIETNYQWLVQRSEWIAGSIAATFPHADAATRLALAEGIDAEELPEPETPAIESFKVGQKLFTGLRGSYGGVLMFGLVTGLAGLPLFNPISLSAGAAFAAKSIYDEGDVRLKRRQAVAKAAAQRHVDDVFLRFSKEFRDLVRSVQRQLRDHFSELTEQLVEHANKARENTQVVAVQRDRRVLELKRELERLAELHSKAGQLGMRALQRGTAGGITA